MEPASGEGGAGVTLERKFSFSYSCKKAGGNICIHGTVISFIHLLFLAALSCG